MKKIPKAFLSTLLAQKKLSGNGNSGNNTLSDNYSFNSNIKELPTFTIPVREERDDYGLPIAEIAVTFARKAKRVYEKALISVRGKELIVKADEYEIPYDKNDIDFLALQDKVEEFEEIVAQAAQYGIDWQSFGYDMLGIEQEISDMEEAESDYMNYARSQFLGTRGVEA